MKNLKKDRENARKKSRYCAFCRSPLRVFGKKHIRMENVLGALVSSGLLMYLIWQQFDPRVIAMFIALLGVSEILIQFRWRFSVICHNCGFDPVLYMQDRKKTAVKVKKHLELREKDPRNWLRPRLQIEPRVLSPEEQRGLEPQKPSPIDEYFDPLNQNALGSENPVEELPGAH